MPAPCPSGSSTDSEPKVEFWQLLREDPEPARRRRPACGGCHSLPASPCTHWLGERSSGLKERSQSLSKKLWGRRRSEAMP
ncbi:hypothetical protein LUU34_01526200 [Aix galericulata]|nr:hypothetical protein LUU34_01526200 [Aix galericulata]